MLLLFPASVCFWLLLAFIGFLASVGLHGISRKVRSEVNGTDHKIEENADL